MDEMQEGISNDAQRPDEFPVLTKVIWFRRIFSVITILVVSLLVILIFGSGSGECTYPFMFLLGYVLASCGALVVLSSLLIAWGLAGRKTWAVWLAFAHNAFVLWLILYWLSSIMEYVVRDARHLLGLVFVLPIAALAAELGGFLTQAVSSFGLGPSGVLLAAMAWETNILIRALIKYKRELRSNEPA